MAKKEETKIVLERVYNVPLRREFLKVQRWRRAEKAVKALKQFISKHMKSENVILGKYANEFLWKDGIKNPAHHIKVSAKKDNNGRVTVELAELSPKAKREIEKKDSKAKVVQIKAEKIEGKIEEKVEQVKKEKEEKAKEIEKEEIKELQKEHPKQHIRKQPPIPKEAEWHPSAPKSV